MLTFTRYLYLKDEVKLSLIISLLNKKESALFWAYELYYSGFEEELFQHLWKIYFDFYYTLNPSFQDYFIKKYNEWRKIPKTEQTVALIVNNLLIRPHNLDVFLLRQTEKNEKIKSEEFSKLLETYDFKGIANIVLHLFALNMRKEASFSHSKTPTKCAFLMRNGVNVTDLKDSILYFSKKGIKIDEEKTLKKWKKTAGFLKIDEQVQLLAFIMEKFTQLSEIKQGKKLYMSVDKNDIIQYETIFKGESTDNRAYKILPKAYLYKIDQDNYLSLFHLERNNIVDTDPDGLRKIYWYNWEYYASFSPVWHKRMQECNGKWNHETKRVDFPDDEDTDWPELFYSEYGYEPDEQKREIQEHSIQRIEKGRTWSSFFEEHRKNCIYKPTSDDINKIKCIVY